MQYFGADALGSVRQIYNSSGQVIADKRYDPYGNVLAQNGAGTSNYGYTGEWTDATGLEYLRARYYAPTQGRFTTRDAWGGDPNAPMSYNAWNYTNGNPVNLTDPSGKIPDNLGISAVFCDFSSQDLCEALRKVAPTLADFLCTGPSPVLKDLMVETGQIQILKFDERYHLVLGGVEPRIQPGGKISAIVDAPEGTKGTLEWVQNIRTRRIYRRYDGQEFVAPKDNQRWYLDFGPIYPKYPGDNPVQTIARAGAITIHAIDGPDMGLYEQDVYAEVRDDFRTFLVWRPQGLWGNA